jgi:hypothetical protein
VFAAAGQAEKRYRVQVDYLYSEYGEWQPRPKSHTGKYVLFERVVCIGLESGRGCIGVVVMLGWCCVVCVSSLMLRASQAVVGRLVLFIFRD